MAWIKRYWWIGTIALTLFAVAGSSLWYFKTKDTTESNPDDPIQDQASRETSDESSDFVEPIGDVSLDDGVLFEVNEEGRGTLNGFSLRFTKPVARYVPESIDQKKLDIVLKPEVPYSGRWLSNREFSVRFNQDFAPNKTVQIDVRKIPLGKKRNVILSKNTGRPWDIKTPKPILENVTLTEFKLKRSVDLLLTWNYPIEPSELKRKLVISLRNDRGQVSKFQKNMLSVKNKSEKQARILIKSRKLSSGSLSFSLSSPLKIAGFVTRKIARDTVDLEPTEPLKLGNMRATQGTESFGIDVACVTKEIEAAGDDYYRPKPKCELDPMEARKFISINPSVEFSVVSGRGGFKLIGDFKPETRYAFSFLPGLAANKRYVLTERIERSLQTGNLKSSFQFSQKARYLPSFGGASLAFESINNDKMKVKVYRIYPQNLTFWLTKSFETPSKDVADLVKEFELVIPGQKNQKFKGTLALDEFKPKGNGVYYIGVTSPKKNSVQDFAAIVVTDIGVVAKREKDKLHFWTINLKDLSPKKNISARVVTYSNKTLGQCQTSGSEAHCAISGAFSDKQAPFAVLLSGAGDSSYIRFTDLAIESDRVHAGSRSFERKDTPLDSYVYTSRGVYRPGETANMAAVVRTTQGETAANVPVQWKIKSPKNKVIREIATTTSENGMSELDFETSDRFQTGKYSVELTSGEKLVGTGAFLVEEFVPERIAVSVNAARPYYVDVQKSDFSVEAKFLFGPPVAGGSYTQFCSIVPAFYQIPKNPSYATGAYAETKASPIVLETKTGTLDKQGKAKLSCQYGDIRYPTVMKLSQRIDVMEAGSGRVTSNSADTLLSSTQTLIGLKTLKADDKSIDVEGALFNLKGEKVSSKERYSYSLFQLRREWFYTTNDYGYGNWVSEQVLIPTSEAKLISLKPKSSSFRLSLKPSQSYGDFLVRVKSLESGYTTDLKVSLGWSWWSWNNNRNQNSSTPRPPAPGELKVTASTKELRPGEEFDLEFESPFSGKALVSLETDSLKHSQWITAKKGLQKLKLKAPDVLPNFYASVLVLKTPESGPEGYLPARAWGATSITVKPEKYDLRLKVNAPKQMRGNNEIVLQLENENKLPAEYSVAVVDEGILQLTKFTTPNPKSYFFEPRRLEVQSFDTLGWTFAKLPFQGTAGGGGELGDSGRASKIMPVRLVSRWKGSTLSDKQGNATVRFPIPAFQGKVRVMVVASTQTGRMGSFDRNVIIRDPLVLQPTFPRFLSQHDKVSVPVFVTNTTTKEQSVTVELDSSDNIQLGSNKAKATIPAGKGHTYHFTAKALAFSGKAQFKVTAFSEKERSEDSTTIPIIPRTPEYTLMLSKKPDGPIRLASDIPGDMRLEALELDASISTVPHLAELGHLSHLIRYPYGCIEQTTSSTYPLLTLGDLLEWADPEAASTHDIEDMVNRGIDRILSMQTGSGGFSYWPGGTEPVVWATAYATNMLLDAKSQGYSVPQDSLDSALQYLNYSVGSGRHRTVTSEQVNRSEPFLLFVLAKAGRPNKARIKALIEQKQSWGHLDTENSFLLGLSAQLSGQRDLVDRIFEDKELFHREAHEGRTHSNTFWSNLRTDGMRLSLLEDVFPEHEGSELLAARVAKSLSGQSAHYTTQELAWAISGLGKRVAAYKGVRISNPSLKVDGKIIPASFEPKKQAPIWHLAQGFNFQKSVLRFAYESTKTPFVYLKLKGYAKDFRAADTATVNFDLDRSYYNLDGTPADLKKVKRGQLMVVGVELSNRSRKALENFAVVDRLPAGFEIENARLGREQKLEWVNDVYEPDYVDIRDDRIQFFGNLGPSYRSATAKVFYYIVRAVSEGSFTIPSAKMELMYQPDKYAFTETQKVAIRR